MSRLVARDGLSAKEVRLYAQSELGADSLLTDRRGGSDAALSQVEYDSLDILDLVPWIVLLAAQEKAREIVAEAKTQAEELRQEELRRSAAEGRAEAKAELMPALAAFAAARQSLLTFEERLIQRCTPQLVRLALEIAEKIIAKAAKADGEIVAAAVERAKREILDAKQIRIWLHPEDLQVLTELRPDLVKVGDEAGRSVEIAAAAEIERGGCRIETESGIVDATVPSQIAELSRQLLDEEDSTAGDPSSQ